MGSFTSGVRDLATSAGASVEASINETVIRLAVTGLSRAGKTVFITSMIENLLALGTGRNTLPRLTSVLTADGQSRLRRVEVLPGGAASVPYFDFGSKFADLASEQPSWPPRTEDIAQISLSIEVQRVEPLWRKLGNRRIRLDILDYPGEWLLDLPMLDKGYTEWSSETLAMLRRPPHSTLCREFLYFLKGFDVRAKVEDIVLRRGHSLYRAALNACRTKLGMRYLQPGRFLCPGPRADAPFMWFFPAESDGPGYSRGTAGSLLRERFETYKTDMRANFFDTHFVEFDRQIVLVDVLSSLHAGRATYEDTERAIADISASLHYGSRLPKPIQASGAAGIRALALLLPAVKSGGEQNGARPTQIFSRGIERLAFVATKADHVPAMQRDNLRNLVRAIAETARSKQNMANWPVSYHAAASVLSTRDNISAINGRPVEVVSGVPMGEDRDRPFYPGEVPSGRPRDSFWGNGYFEMPVFKPPRIDPSGRTGIPHLEVDSILAAVIGDRL